MLLGDNWRHDMISEISVGIINFGTRQVTAGVGRQPREEAVNRARRPGSEQIRVYSGG